MRPRSRAIASYSVGMAPYEPERMSIGEMPSSVTNEQRNRSLRMTNQCGFEIAEQWWKLAEATEPSKPSRQ